MRYFDKVPALPLHIKITAQSTRQRLKMAIAYTKARNKEIRIQAETYARPISVP